MKIPSIKLLPFLLASLLLGCLETASARIIINEIANKGTSGVCDGEDWIELKNTGPQDVDLGAEHYMLHDNKGINHDKAFIFPNDQPTKTLLKANDYLLLCTKQTLPPVVIDQENADEDDDQVEEWGDSSSSAAAAAAASAAFDAATVPIPPRDDPMSPQFGLSNDDTVTLVKLPQGRNATTNAVAVGKQVPSSTNSIGRYTVVDSVSLPDQSNLPDDSVEAPAFDISYALVGTTTAGTAQFNYTSTPTPGEANVMTQLLTRDELNRLHKQALQQQEALGRRFFNMDERGYPVADAMDTVLELKITMTEEDYNYMMENQTFELYRPFQSAQLLQQDGTEIASYNSPGRVRPKGQGGLFVATCLNTPTIPFQLDFDSTDSSQTLFGVQRVFLRHHMIDFSLSREWAYYRMLARFGMPYLRARKVVFTINNRRHGFYTLVEAPEHEYVFARNFPDYNPDSFALYKFKSLAKGCGDYTKEMLTKAQARIDDGSASNSPPYAFERGIHKKPVVVKNNLAFDFCRQQFMDSWFDDIQPDIVLAYLRHDQDCSQMLLEEGLIDRDLGTKDWDKKMERFIADHLGPNKCDAKCSNSQDSIKEVVDVDNWLKMFAFYATTLSLDSPVSFINNFYMAQSGSETNPGWKIVAYDLNAREAVGCNNDVCNDRLVHWSIARPTCESLESNQLVGPLLTDPDLHDRYLEYVREFVDTIYGNVSTWEEINHHILEVSDAAKDDFWSAYGALHPSEIDPPADAWNNGNYPFLAVIKARTADLKQQLAAIDEAKLSRAPHVGVLGNNEPWETCADWRTQQYNTSKCDNGCKYDGCHVPGWTVESFCDEGTGICYHGDVDDLCFGIPDGERYPGMQNRDDGKDTFCRMARGVPVKTSQCPALGDVSAAAAATTSDQSKGYVHIPWMLALATSAVASILQLV